MNTIRPGFAAAIAGVALLLSVAALAVTAGSGAPEESYDDFVRHCDEALDRSRDGHQALLDELDAMPEGEERDAKSDEVDEDAMRDVCGVKVGDAHAQPLRTFAAFVGQS
ncbi:MAG: hypothetical protein F4Z60_13370 [Chloroflexi bacterium]|nr:hypothetical protein [Chloroflexota bacterium]